MRFLFDFVSPYAFLAWKRLRREPDFPLHPEPVLFAGLLDAHGQRGPAEIEAKRRYLFRDVLRKAACAGIVVSPPHTHPFNPLLALRVVAAADAAARPGLVDALFDATWVHALPVTTEDDLRPILGDAADTLLAAATRAEAKATLRAATEGAVAAGVFGVPTMIVGGELFWGTDAVDFAVAAARGEAAPLPADMVARWEGLRASATRAR